MVLHAHATVTPDNSTQHGPSSPLRSSIGEVGRWLSDCLRRRLTVARRRVVILVLLRIFDVGACCPQRPPFKPCMPFSGTRLSDIVHRQACAAPYRTFPESRYTPSEQNHVHV